MSQPKEDLNQRLSLGLSALPLDVSSSHIERLIDFIKLIAKWNKTYNLTAVRELDAMISLHLLDSLAIMPHLHGKTILDVGTGAGLPGIPLAICCPERQFCLLDSNAKKTRFVQQAVLELKLNNVTVIQQRVEQYHSASGFDTIVTRAFAELSEIIKLTQHLLAPKGIMLAMKSQHLDQENLDTLAQATVIPLTIPGLDAERNVVRLQFSNVAEVS
ncbi:16S rRNA (guanine(527)-N(7))-methyltransferase RsmG [Methylocucumis oryzae]|uniref:Ribosomal RNA small subunit methyltransferase G n=1 Tax=Methylocucumis oryzae TaxID=1632867 RepID=A0A0F3IEJ3_9GAMM|nr:16S rRNA (guanine(527)-N(7))-methyltransferase RsmG [Methylocucumis oryzae]KJV05225.1 ribosomal RNA small subunit methyltransferase G [Methylocucumis oryzae]